MGASRSGIAAGHMPGCYKRPVIGFDHRPFVWLPNVEDSLKNWIKKLGEKLA
jgi:hypothetical protein